MAAVADTPSRRDAPLDRVISCNMLLAFVVGDMLGAGIYALVEAANTSLSRPD